MPYPCPLWWVGELILPLTSCSTQESKPYTSPGQHSTADCVGGGEGELAPLLICHVAVRERERSSPPPLAPPPPLTPPDTCSNDVPVRVGQLVKNL